MAERAILDPSLHSRGFLGLAAVLLGVLSLYFPVFAQFGSQLWWNEDENHSGILILCVLYAYWRDRSAFSFSANRSDRIVGASIVALALLIYTIGRFATFVQLLGASMPLLAFGLSLAFGGRRLAKRWALLSVLLLFCVPWLGTLGDTVLVPLRLIITKAAVHVLSMIGLPVSATGVLVSVGFVQINIAGACVGVRSMISLMAIGILFLHFFPPRSVWAGLVFVTLLPIIGLGANFLRVCFLIAVAGYFGATAEAQVHDLAAYGEVALAICLFALLGNFVGKSEGHS